MLIFYNCYCFRNFCETVCQQMQGYYQSYKNQDHPQNFFNRECGFLQYTFYIQLRAAYQRDVILDEINSYEDSPSELIYDEFENLLFDGHALGHNILGNEQSLLSFDTDAGKSFCTIVCCGR